MKDINGFLCTLVIAFLLTSLSADLEAAQAFGPR